MTTNVLPWDNEMFRIETIENPSKAEGQADRVYGVTNIETGVVEMLTMQLHQAFMYAVQAKETIEKAITLSKPSNVIPFRRNRDDKTPPPAASGVKPN